MTDFQILTAVKNNGGCLDYTALLNLNMTDTARDSLADKSRIEQLISDGLLSGATDAYCQITITNDGRQYLQDAFYLEKQNQKLAEEAAKKETKKNRHDWGIAIGSAFIAGLVGLAFEIVAYFLFS